jgi:hypothetical protein
VLVESCAKNSLSRREREIMDLALRNNAIRRDTAFPESKIRPTKTKRHWAHSLYSRKSGISTA